MIVMEKVGDIDWDRMYSPFYQHQLPCPSITYSRISRLQQIISNLHSLGFVHRDIHDENIRLSLSNPLAVWLIDFGKVRLINEQDRLNDLEAIKKLISSNFISSDEICFN